MDKLVKMLPSDIQQAYDQLDEVHMKSLRDYVYKNIVYKHGEKLRTKSQLIHAITGIISKTRESQRVTRLKNPVSSTTSKYARESVTACHALISAGDKLCRRRNTLLSTRRRAKCRDRSAAINDPAFEKMERNIVRLSENPGQDDTEISAAGDIGEYLGTCRAIGCSSYLKYPARGVCSKAPTKSSLR